MKRKCAFMLFLITSFVFSAQPCEIEYRYMQRKARDYQIWFEGSGPNHPYTIASLNALAGAGMAYNICMMSY